VVSPPTPAPQEGGSVSLSTPEEIDGAQAVDIREAQGGSYWERFNAKVLANDPERLKIWYQLRGHEVTEYGSGFNFAVRQAGSKGPYRPIDMEGLDAGDVMIDTLPEFAVGALTEMIRAMGARAGLFAGAPGGPVTAGAGALAGEMAFGGVAGATEDALLQGLGVLTGVNEKIDLTQVALVGGLSALVPGAFAGGRRLAKASKPLVKEGFKKAGESAIGQKVKSGAKRAGTEVLDIVAGFAGFPRDFSLPAVESLINTARRGTKPAPSLLDAVDITRNLSEQVNSRTYKESIDLSALVRDTSKGLIDATDELRDIAKATAKRIELDSDKVAFSNLRDDILIAASLDPNAPLKNPITGQFTGRVLLEPETAMKLKSQFGKLASDAGIFTSRNLPQSRKQVEKRVAESWQTLRDKIRGNLRGAGSAEEFDRLNTVLERRLRTSFAIERFTGKGTTRENIGNIAAMGELASPEGFFFGLRGATRQQQLRTVREFDDVFGPEIAEYWERAIKNTPAEELHKAGLLPPGLEELGKVARIGTSFGESTHPGFIPPLASTGNVKGVAAFSSMVPALTFGAAGGAGLMDPTTSALLATGSLALASPRILQGIVSPFVSGAASRGFNSMLAKTSALAASAAANPGTRAFANSMARQLGQRIEAQTGDRKVARERDNVSAKRKELSRP